MPDIFNLTDANLAANAAISPSKTRPPRCWPLSQATGTAIVAANYSGPIVRGTAAVIASIEASITGLIATGGDRTVDVNLLRSTGGGAFGTVLSANIQFTSGSTLRAISTGTLASTTLADGDMLQVTVAVAGAAGNQAQGLSVTVNWYEDWA